MSLRLRAAALALCTVAVFAHGAVAQTLTPPIQVLAPPTPTRPVPEGDIVLEGAVDADVYRLGPGDVFTVSIGGSRPYQTQVTVAADGVLVVPEGGTFQAAGRTLSAVRADVRAALRQQFRGPVDIALTAPRQFYVRVAGAVPEPGRHLMSAVARLDDALSAAAGGSSAETLAAYDSLRTFPIEIRRRDAPRITLPALRNVRIDRRDGRTETVDLARYLATGDLTWNPLLLDGDVVYLPTFSPYEEGVFVTGAVAETGVYDVRPADTALDLLDVVTGGDPRQTLASVRLTRVEQGRAVVREVALAEAGSIALRPLDQLFVVASEPRAGIAEALGALAYPGAYPIVVGQTTLSDLVERAGGLRADAFLRGAFLERAVQTLPRTVSQETPRLTGLATLDRQYLVTEFYGMPRLTIDLEAALSGRERVLLEDGDRLVIPEGRPFVRVFGQVVQPGYVPYRDGATAADYVESAGGAGPNAVGTFVLEMGTGRLIEGASAVVASGDAVFVQRETSPEDVGLATYALAVESEARAERESRRAARNQTYQVLLGAVSAVASVALAVVALGRNSN